MCKCKFYECDLAAKKEAEEMCAFYEQGISLSEREAMDAWAASQEQDAVPDPLAGCGEFCKHLKSDKGFPGEYVYYCTALGNEHVIHTDFREYEII